MHRTSTFSARIIFASLTILASGQLSAQWDPLAGVVPSFTDGAQLSASAPGFNDLANIIDGDNNTAWQSTNPLPANYVGRPSQNVLLGKGSEWCTASSAADFAAITDNDFNSHTAIDVQGGKAWLEFTFPASQPMLLLHFKAQVQAALSVYIYPEGQDSLLLGEYSSADNYSFKRFDFSGVAAKIRLEATATFTVFEVGMLAEPPKESVILDFGAVRDIGRITTRHWAGIEAASATAIYISQDSTTWEYIAGLDPEAIGPVTTFLNPSRLARYLKIEHTLLPVDYKKVNFWEVAAFDSNGPYGPMPPPQPSAVTAGQLLGINGIWGWGHNTHSINLPPGEGPQLYNQFAANGRNYHFWGWDVTDPDTIPDFEAMAAGNGTQAQWWLNWDNEYSAWQNAGLEIDCSIQMGTWDESDFSDPYTAGFNYAKAFAAHFGPTSGNGQVTILEAGNEPWHLDSLFYRDLLRGMAEGVKAGDPALKILPCALQAAFPQNENTTSSRNFMGARITEETAALLDGLNLHLYSFAFDEEGARIAVWPEHPDSDMRELFNALRWRDHNMPSTPIYMTEWGWDHDGAGEDCTHSECVTEKEAVAYFTRGALMLLRTQVQRADIYFYANTGGASSLFARSGVTGSLATNFEKKKSFLALESLAHTLGDKYFLSAIKEDSTAWLYLLGTADGTPTHLAAWRPIDANNSETVEVAWETALHPVSAVLLDGETATGSAVVLPAWEAGKLTIPVSAIPIVVALDSLNTATTGPVREESLTVVPNPATQKFEVQWQASGSCQAVKLAIYSPAGEMRYQQAIPAGATHVSVEKTGLPAGLYLVELSFKTGEKRVRKLVML